MRAGLARALPTLVAVLLAAAIAGITTVRQDSTALTAAAASTPLEAPVASFLPDATDQSGQRGEPAPSPAADVELVQRGRQLYGAGCAGCHGQQGGGTNRGPTLLGVGPANVDFQLSSGRMPLAEPVPQPQRKPPAYSRPDIDALVAYVTSLAPGGPQIPRLPAGDLQTGRQLYLTNCASCHGSSGVGAALPAGRVAPNVLGVPSTQVAEAVRVGPGLMPQFPATAIPDQQLADIVAYLEDLPSHEAHGGWPIGAVGPVTEGFVGWVLGLGLLLIVIRLLGRRAPS